MTTALAPRRVRHAPPEPGSRRIALTDADYLIFHAIDRHGPLPSSYLYEFTRHIRRDRTHLQNRLTEFYNGDGRGGLLTRPPQQFQSYQARYQHLVYDLAPRARMLLAERGTMSTPRSDPFVHRLMCGCVSASFELAARAHRLRYIGLSEILARPRAAAAHESPNPLAIPVPLPGAPVAVPDLLFGFEYPNGAGYRFFAVECDRNTESIERRNVGQSAFGRKLTNYAALLNAGTYRTWWGVPNLHVLTVTTSARHAANILAFARGRIPPTLFGITVTPEFGVDWRVPKEPLAHLLSDPWRALDGMKDIAR